MANIKGRAGRNIRLLAFFRRYKAIGSFVGAGIVIYLPFLLANFIKVILQPLADSNPNVNNTQVLPPLVYIATTIMAIVLVANGVFLWKRANHADQSAKGEEDIADELFELTNDGWQIEYGNRLGKGGGDIDIICVSPSKKTFVIDVKSHKGTVFAKASKLYRRLGNKQYPFEKDFLAQVMKQALQVKRAKKVNFVTSILVFSAAKVAVVSGKVKHVYVFERTELVRLLKSF
ncbi:MAG: nuclease-related domain-containing protein [Cyanobacteria bacterium P01_C01_bin.118]